MKTRAAIFSLLICAPLVAREKTDIIVMKNGDRFTGEVKALASGVLYVDLDYVDGTISVSWSRIAHIESNQLFIVTTVDGLVYSGKLSTRDASADQSAVIEIEQGPDSRVEVAPTQVVEMVGTSENFWSRFNGGLSYGIIYSKANRATQFNFSGDAAYVRERWSAQATVTSTLSASTGVSTATRNQYTFVGTHLLPWNNYFYSGIADFLESSSQGIKLQTSIGGGVGRYFKNTNRFSFSMVAGLAWQSTVYETPSTEEGPEPAAPSNQNVAAGMVTARLKMFKFKKTNLDVAAMLFPVLSEPGRVRFYTNASYYVKLFSNLSWNLTFYGNWDNRPPDQFSGSDYGTSSGLSWTFGLK